MRLHDLKPAAGSRHRRKILGRGIGSGHGKTAGKGHKGQKARAGGGSRPWFEGGQLPLHRRVPKRGFTNIFRIRYAVVNVKDLNRFDPGAAVTPDALRATGLVRDPQDGIKVLGDGAVTRALIVSAHRFSKMAAAKIRAAGGTVEVLAALPARAGATRG
jgi:large subunit ribosomal protein L15